MIQTEKEYNAIVERVEELLQNPNIIENQDAKGYIELNLLSDFVSDYEELFLLKTSLVEVCMAEIN